jgi:APA family basic amino acid/polyamine antiporter
MVAVETTRSMRTSCIARETGGWRTRGTGRAESRQAPLSSGCATGAIGGGPGGGGNCATVVARLVRAVNTSVAIANMHVDFALQSPSSFARRVFGAAPPRQVTLQHPKLLRRLGSRDAALIVMGGIVGSGIFMNPSVVARFVGNGTLVMLVWIAGGAIALLGAGIFAELAARRPRDGGLYAYMRDAFHPAVAFIYGWTLLLVSQSGGMAAAAVTFANYFAQLTRYQASSEAIVAIAVLAIAVFTGVNALGVRTGTTTQNAFMVAKILAIGGFAAIGLFVVHAVAPPLAAPAPVVLGNPLAVIGLAMVPVLFSYSGWQTSSFMSAELRDPHSTLPRGLIAGVIAVLILYLAVNATCLRALGIAGLAATNTPASDVAALAFGQIGRSIMAIVISLSTLGFLSNQILTSPRVYFQMAEDGTFFKQLAWVSRRTHSPVVAIVAQGIVAMVIALSGKYDQILNYVTSNDYIFFGLAAIALVVFRIRDARDPNAPKPAFRMPGHPYTTLLFLVAAWYIVADTILKAPRDTAWGIGLLLSGLPVYALFAWRASARRSFAPSAHDPRQ